LRESVFTFVSQPYRQLVAETLLASGGLAEAPALSGQNQLPALKPGQLAPPLAWDGLAGKKISLKSFRGNPTMLLFWDPDCGFCQRMLPSVQAWEANSPAGAPRLLVISRGSVETNRGLGLRSPLALDQTGLAARAFGASGTPMAVLLDSNSVIVSGLAIGADAVLELAGSASSVSGQLNAGPVGRRI